MDEKEYIEREALIDALMMYTWRDEDDREIDDSDEKRKFIEEWFPSIPAADVRPVVRGKWERKRDKCGSFVSCSVCHTSGWYQFAFCPYCGADMRKEGGEKDV